MQLTIMLGKVRLGLIWSGLVKIALNLSENDKN